MRRHELPPRQSRVNLSGLRALRQEWERVHSEQLPIQYYLHYSDGGCRRVNCGRLGLIAEIKETKPIRIERVE